MRQQKIYLNLGRRELDTEITVNFLTDLLLGQKVVDCLGVDLVCLSDGYFMEVSNYDFADNETIVEVGYEQQNHYYVVFNNTDKNLFRIVYITKVYN